MEFKFEKLNTWQQAMEFGEAIHALVVQFPKEEQESLSSQTRKSADAIALKISVGSIVQSNAELKKYISESIGSLAEAVTCLHKAKNRNYITEVEFMKHHEAAHHLMALLVAFKRKIK